MTKSDHPILDAAWLAAEKRVARGEKLSGAEIRRLISAELDRERVPKRIQRKRTKGWRMPPNTVSVTRPGKHGNPYYPGSGLGYGRINKEGKPVSWDIGDPRVQVMFFKWRMDDMKKHEQTKYEAYIAPLRGKNLACWCKLGDPCHGDVLLELANKEDA